MWRPGTEVTPILIGQLQVLSQILQGSLDVVPGHRILPSEVIALQIPRTLGMIARDFVLQKILVWLFATHS